MQMVEIAHSIDLDLPEKLRDRKFRQKFFLAEASAQVAAQLIALRKRRNLNQKEVAELVGTQQPAISRVEKADYQSWSFSILRKIADALDARIRIFIEPYEDIIQEYKDNQYLEVAPPSELAALKEILRSNPLGVVPSQKERKHSRRLASLFPEDNASAANYRAHVHEVGEVPKLVSAVDSAALQRPEREPLVTVRV